MDQGQIDAISQTDPVMTMLEQDGKVKIIADTRTPEGHAEAVRRADAGGQPLRADRVRAEEPEHRARR